MRVALTCESTYGEFMEWRHCHWQWGPVASQLSMLYVLWPGCRKRANAFEIPSAFNACAYLPHISFVLCYCQPGSLPPAWIHTKSGVAWHTVHTERWWRWWCVECQARGPIDRVAPWPHGPMALWPSEMMMRDGNVDISITKWNIFARVIREEQMEWFWAEPTIHILSWIPPIRL